MGPSSSGDSFVHLHVHTEYSMLDGAARLDDLFTACQEMAMPALAMTDHGNLYGAFDFVTRATAAGIAPIVGTEAYIAPGSRFERKAPAGAQSAKTDKYSHMTLLAVDDTGYSNLVQLSSLASLEGYYYKPRMDTELLERYSGGLVATTGCPGGEVSQHLYRGNYDAARRAAGKYAEIFGRGNYYVELMQHGLEIEKVVIPGLLQIAEDLDLPLVATNDLHYTRKQDATAQEVLLCVQTGSTMSDPNRFRFEAEEFYLKSPAEMRHLFRGHPEACDNTLVIAERVDFTFQTGKDLLPRFEVPDGHTEQSWLAAEVERGMHRRYGQDPSEAVRAQVAYELGVINQMGFPAYFLVVADLVRYAQDNGIRVGPGRGSAAGCTVSYCLGITALDPLEHGLIFERFLNPERVSMPDIDMDFDERRRGDMIRYATEKYGEDRVAQIITYGTIKAKAAVKDASRVLGYPYSLGDRITKSMPTAVMGRDVSLSDCFDPASPRYSEAGELRGLYAAEPDVAKVIDTARGLEGLKRQVGVHAAGVVMCRDPLTDHVPVWRRDADGAVITQFDMNAVEKIGLLKMDFLGLRNLTVLDDCLAHIAANREQTVVLEDLGLDDPAAYALLCRGDTIGVFQLEGGPMRSLMRSLAPSCFADVSALIALYRPGPMGEGSHIKFVERKHGRQPIPARHPALDEILAETYGVVVYQEQVMTIAQQLAGYSLGQADELRRAMGKKKREVLAKEKVKFVQGFVDRGETEAFGEQIFTELEPFADYAFNKAHSAGYGLVSYWTAYLKAHYPAEYMAALLTSVKDDKDKSALYLNECRRMGIKVLPPDVNDSDSDFTPRGTDIRFGLSAVRNVGENVVAGIVRSRTSAGRYGDFADFLTKVEPAACNKKVVESLIKSGAFDSLGHTRRGLHSVHVEAVDACMEVKRAEAVGQFSLFGSDPDADAGHDFAVAIPLGEWDKKAQLAFEREMLGLYVSDHPLLGVEHILAAAADTSVARLAEEGLADGTSVTVGGLLTSITRKMSKNGSSWAIAQLEDLDGVVEVMFFPATYVQVAAQLFEDEVVVVTGRVDKRDDVPKIVARELTVPDLSDGPRGPLQLSIPANRCTPPLVERLREVLGAHPGVTEVQLHLVGATQTTVLRLDDSLRVAASPALMGDLKALLGAGCLPL